MVAVVTFQCCHALASDSAMFQQEHAPKDSPMLKILLHKVARLDNVLFSLWQHLHQSFTPLPGWLAIHSIACKKGRHKGPQVAGWMVVGHSATLNAHLDQCIQLTVVREPEPNAHGPHGSPTATFMAIEGNPPAIGLGWLQPPGILH